MKKLIVTLGIAGSLITGELNGQSMASSRKTDSNQAKYVPVSTPSPTKTDIVKIDRKEKLREMLIPLLRGVFNTHRVKLEVLLTIDAGWRNDSLSVEYKYYRGSNVLSLDETMLVEKIYFTLRPEEIDELDTENDEFLFLYLRNSRKKLTVEQLVTRPASHEQERNWQSSMGIPVRAEHLPTIIQYLKELRSED